MTLRCKLWQRGGRILRARNPVVQIQQRSSLWGGKPCLGPAYYRLSGRFSATWLRCVRPASMTFCSRAGTGSVMSCLHHNGPAPSGAVGRILWVAQTAPCFRVNRFRVVGFLATVLFVDAKVI